MNELRSFRSNPVSLALTQIIHQRRHTFSTRALSLGVPIETVSRMIGHSQITTTQIYAKVTNDKIDEDTRGLDELIAGKFQFAV